MLHHVADKVDRLLEHCLAQAVGEGREAVAIDAIVVFELAELEPVAAEFRGEIANLIVLHHAAYLREKYDGILEIAFGRVRDEFVIRHAAPEEIAQAARQFIIAQWNTGGR